MPKLFDTIATRYRNRPGGYTRLHKLPPRYGDMAPLAILELVDGKRDMLYSMTARNVARSKLLGTKWISLSTRDKMHQVIKFRGPNAVKEFDEEVALQETILMKEDAEYEKWQKHKATKTVEDIQKRIDERENYTISPYYKRK